MNILKFNELHLNLKVVCPRSFETNCLPSATDPTQDIPIKNIELASNGQPINVKNFNAVFSNLKPEQFTNIEKRNNDKFDVLGELQNEAAKVSKIKNISTNYVINKVKKIKANEKDN